MFASTGQLVGQERQVGDEVEDPVEGAGYRRAVLVLVAPPALLRDQDRGDQGKGQPEQADRMTDPADHD
jgi:hypothetical protein